jgi:hypothetical protein
MALNKVIDGRYGGLSRAGWNQRQQSRAIKAEREEKNRQADLKKAELSADTSKEVAEIQGRNAMSRESLSQTGQTKRRNLADVAALERDKQSSTSSLAKQKDDQKFKVGLASVQANAPQWKIIGEDPKTMQPMYGWVTPPGAGEGLGSVEDPVATGIDAYLNNGGSEPQPQPQRQGLQQVDQNAIHQNPETGVYYNDHPGRMFGNPAQTSLSSVPAALKTMQPSHQGGASLAAVNNPPVNQPAPVQPQQPQASLASVHQNASVPQPSPVQEPAQQYNPNSLGGLMDRMKSWSSMTPEEKKAAFRKKQSSNPWVR